MKIETNVTINLSEDDVKKIIAEYICDNTEYQVTAKDVTISVGSRLEGYGRCENPVTYFKGVHVNCKE